jgi:tetratricopeptide (TPR) repeat protein
VPRRFKAIGLHPGLLLAVVLMLGWLAVHRVLPPLGLELYQLTRQGPIALAHYARGEYGDAARAYRLGLQGELPGGYADDPWGVYALTRGYVDEAYRRAHASLTLMPDGVEALVTLAEVALERGQAAEAVAQLDEALRRRPDHADALFLSSVALARAGRVSGAVTRLNDALRYGSTGSRPTILFRLMELTGDLSDAPREQRPLSLLAVLHRYLRIFDPAHAALAMEYARAAVAAGDQPAEAWVTIGVIHAKQEDHEAAAVALRKALEINPRHAEAYRWLALGASYRGDYLAAYQMMRAAFEAAPRDAFYLTEVESVVNTWLQDPHTISQVMQRALEHNPANQTARVRLERSRRALAGVAPP